MKRTRTISWVPAVGLAACCVWLLAAVSCRAVVVLGEFDWDNPPSLQGWTTDQGWTSIVNPGGGGSGYMQISLSATDPTPSEEWSSLVSVEASSLFAGNWQGDMAVSFDFMAQDFVPGALQLQWQGGSGFTWRYVLSPAATTGDWGTYTASFANWEDWDFPGATEEMFLSDLASIDWIGIYILRNSPEAQIFGIDNFQLMIPEPGEYAMVIAALGVTLMALRRRGLARSDAGS